MLWDDREGGSVHLLAGPALGLQMGCRFDLEDFDRGDPLGCDEALLDYRKLDVGLAGGAEFDIRLTDSVNALLGALYAHGLFDIRKGDRAARHRGPHAGLAVPLPRAR